MDSWQKPLRPIPPDGRFRADVEGLRAFAVFAVIIYHYSNGKTAGFIGVDIFFVISGFLITRLIIRDLELKRFSFTNFYARRMRRILPALLVTIVATLAAGTVLFSPDALILLGQQASFSLLGVSNIYFWATSGYFAPEAHSQPLLHTWSLGVEEQFYLLWPLLLLLMARTFGLQTRAALTAIGLVIAASFVCIFLPRGDFSTFAFFMLPTRAWQLAMGGLLVFLPNLRSRYLAETTRGIGLGLVLFAILMIEPETTYPGALALMPTVGTALLIWPTERLTYVASFFSLAPLRYFGRISYSLYLWHWPPMVMFLTWNLASSLTIHEAIGLFLVSWGAAHLSWRFVEEPIRRSRLSDLRTLGTSAVLVCGAAAVSWLLVIADGLPSRLTAAGQELAKKMERERERTQPISCNYRDVIEKNASCVSPIAEGTHVLIMGDSHASHFLSAIQEAFPSAKISTIIRSGCRPVIEAVGRPECVAMYDRFYKDVLPELRFSAIIVSARWRNGEYHNIGATVDILSNYADRVIVLGQTVEYDYSLPELLMASYLPRRSSDVQAFMSRWPEIQEIDRRMAQELSGQPVEYYSILEAVCPGGECTFLSLSGVPLVWDYGHFNTSGATLIVERLKLKGFSLP